MPELPEVETIVRDLRPILVGRRVERATLSHTDILRGVTGRLLTTGLAGRTITGMHRRAKHAVLEMGDRRLVVQPGMSGSLLMFDRPMTTAETKYAVLRASLDDGRELVYRDVRRLGTLLFVNNEDWDTYDQALGPEPLDPALTPERFAAAIRGSRQAVKKLIMDQRVIVGVGNIYANEALFASGIDPSKPGNRVEQESAERLLLEIRSVLTAAIERRGTTFRDYRTGTGQIGDFQGELWVYGREGEQCVTCGTRLSGTHLIDARITIFCHRCQS